MINKAEWYVIQVISGTEENVKQSIFQRRESFGLEDHILDVFVPTHDVISVRATGAQVKKKKNLLPGYILVQMVVTNESWYIVRNTPNVTGFLGAGNIPVPVSGEELEKLKGKLKENAETFETKYQVGDIATIMKGPFEGNEGNIIDVNEKKGTVKVNINLLGRDTPIELDFAEVKVK
ncbi:transcription termination/antitermination factor NusG [Candidatus Gracilibacteria bacterium 28_42_T64]|nr:transcription termination/antitermination factor NusG [Candidatus Gracilibacteria bacterium 28_42_T64]